MYSLPSLSNFTKIFFVAALLVTVASCERQSCKNVVCPVGQNCYQGNCYCPDGYEGTDCQTESYLKYTSLNNFASESCNQSPPFITSSCFIQQGSSVNQLQIYGLMGGNCSPTYALIRTDTNNEGNIVEIPEQNCGGSTISGQGTYDKLNGRLNLQLYYNFSGSIFQCNTTLY